MRKPSRTAYYYMVQTVSVSITNCRYFGSTAKPTIKLMQTKDSSISISAPSIDAFGYFVKNRRCSGITRVDLVALK